MGGTELADAWRSSIGAGGALSASELDVLFEVLADRERRRILRYFAESDDESDSDPYVRASATISSTAGSPRYRTVSLRSSYSMKPTSASLGK